jgi:hypothetical protein
MDGGWKLGKLADDEALKKRDRTQNFGDGVFLSHDFAPLTKRAMLHAAQIAAIVLTALAMAPALAHAFEFPGKKRLDRDAYVVVQGIFYPGFTLLGLSEPAAMIATLVLLIVTPKHTLPFLLTALALVCLLGMHAVYWAFTHATNRYWLATAEATLSTAGSKFFAAGASTRAADWTKLRDRWEYSHIARAVLAFLSFVLITLAVVL